jgi:hypothetical protein
VKRKSDVAHTKSISNAANNQAVSWTIGSKPKANLNAGCFGLRRRARKGSATSPGWIILRHGCIIRRSHGWDHVAHSATRGTDAVNRNRRAIEVQPVMVSEAGRIVALRILDAIHHSNFNPN